MMLLFKDPPMQRKVKLKMFLPERGSLEEKQSTYDLI